MFLESKAAPVDDSIPNKENVARALEASVHDSKGELHQLSSILKDRRTIIIFIRHNHCGMCMEYIKSCGKDETLRSTTKDQTGTQVIIIGHGSWQGIELYRKNTETPFEIYMDEEKNVFEALGLNRRFLGKSKEAEKSRATYIEQGKTAFSVTMSSIYGMVTSGSLISKGGEFALLGGEFVFDKGQSLE